MTNFTTPLSTNTTSNSSIIVDFLPLTYPFGAACIPIFLLGTFGSVVCMYQTWDQYKKKPASIHLLFFSLSVATLLFSCFSLPLTSYTMMVGPTNFLARTIRFCRGHAYIYFPLITCCAYSHAAIALQRFFVVILSSRFPWLKSGWVTASLVAISWVVPCLIFIFPVFGVWGVFGFSLPKNRCVFLTLNSTYQITYKILYSFVPLSVIVISYGSIIQREIASKRRLASGGHQVGPVKELSKEEKKKKREKKQELKATKIACITSVAFVICYLPYSIFGVAAQNLKGLQSSVGMGFDFWVWIGCSLNPTVYAFLNSDLRKKLNGKSVAGDKQTLGDAASGATALTSDKQKGHKSMAED